MTASHEIHSTKPSGTPYDYAPPPPSRNAPPTPMRPDSRHVAGRRRTVAVLGGLALAMVAGGCGSERATTGPPSTATSGAPTQAVGIAAELKRDEADPCRLLSGGPAAQLALSPGTLVTSSEGLGGRACRLTNFPDKPVGVPGKTYLVQLLDNPGNLVSDDGAVPPIEELPTKRGTPSGATADTTCAYVVDLTTLSTPSRYLWVQYANLARDDPSMSHQIACDRASVAAAAVIRSLNRDAG